MAVSIKASRFAFLPDDAPDPLSKTKKASTKGSGSEGPSKSKSASKKTDGNATTSKSNAKPNKQSLHNLAFGGLNDGKKKGKAVAAAPVLLKNESQELDPGRSSSDIGAGDLPVKGVDAFENTQFVDCRTKKGPKMSKAQWDEWQRRDNELAAEAYENDLEQALIQSQLEFQKKELPRIKENGTSSKSNKSKKKAAAVPLNEFNAKMLETKPVLPSHPHQNNQVPSNIPPGLWQSPYVNGNSEEELVEKFRADAKLEMERQKQLALEREILKNRRDKSHDQRKATKSSPAKPHVDIKDEKISNLTTENEGLRSDIESYKERLKKVYNILQEAQELKDKAKLLYEVENLTKLNQDLNDEINALHSQLEQERSKSHTALNECRKLMEQSRRRTTTEPSQ